LYNRKNRTGDKWLAAILMITCLTFLAGQGVYAQEYRLGDIPLHPKTYKKHLKVWPMEMAEFLPSSYDARDEGFVTPAKNQGSCGSCWAFASVGAMESHLMKAYQVGPEDLSEQQQVSCNTSMAGCNGGSSSAILYWQTKGPLGESCFPYTAIDTTPCGESGCEQLGYRVIDWHTLGEGDFKNSLYTYGPSYWRFNVHQDFYYYWNFGEPEEVYVNLLEDFKGGHAVLLIGWDDSKGAYLCKNSWGINGGPINDGTFWIAYSGHANNLSFGMANFSLTAVGCSYDTDCDDGVYCNGAETCVDSSCQVGTPPDCSDNGLYCDGSEICNEANQGCGHTGDPCGEGTICNEENDMCRPETCDNYVCDEGEDCNTCPEDCKSGIGGGTCDVCFKGECNGICHPNKEGPDCADCAQSWCCGDGVCEGDEDSSNCEIDCGPPPICGNGACDLGEDQCSCPDDCDMPPSTEVDCSNGIDDDCDNLVDCNDSDCSDYFNCTCLPKGSNCDADSDCCNNKCRGGKCR
jgi:hypothetical protein